MEKKVEYKQVTKEFITYVANDGEILFSEDECKKYEKTADCAIRGAMENITQKKTIGENILGDAACFAYESTMRSIPIRDVNDVEIVNRWIINVHKSSNIKDYTLLDKSSIGKTIIFEEYDGYLYIYGTIDDMVKQFKDTLEKYLGVNDTENN